MNWNHVQLIFRREMIDQLRDRRTLFTITILPLLLYPLLGMLMMQVAQFYRQNPSKVGVIGLEHWPSELPLLDQHGNLLLQTIPNDVQRMVHFHVVDWPDQSKANSGLLGGGGVAADPPSIELNAGDKGRQVSEEVQEYAQQLMLSERFDAVLLVAPGFRNKLNQSDGRTQAISSDAPIETKNPGSKSAKSEERELLILTNTVRDQSSIAQARVTHVVDRWWDQWRMRALSKAGLPTAFSGPIELGLVDTSPTTVRQAVRWSKILPFVLLVWALTGAFYPAVDLCAGEKERGTLETLLSSPARRREIVWGKLLTINVFSMASAMLNLMSMQLTTGMVVKSLAASGTANIAESLGPVPVHALGWLMLLLIPMSAFFSALALAVAALAKSTKEGQYYLMPLLLVTLPLVALPMIPSMEMNLGTSLIPVSGAVFLVRSLIEGRIAEAMVHLPAVLLVTGFCCWLATRWAIRQFESESVMFHEGGRWDLRIWLHHLWRDREDTAQPSVALLCGVLILVGRFFMQFFMGGSESLLATTVLVQVGLILTPCVIMAMLLTRSPRRAMRIHRTQWSHVVAAVLIGFALHPTYQALGKAIMEIFPISSETLLILKQFEGKILSQELWVLLLTLALLPAICEELAFRGFVFGGLLRKQGVLRAIVVSSLLFGFTHAVLQQSIAASLMGLVLGLIAWRTGGVFCTIVVHAVNNGLSLTMAWCGAREIREISVPDALSWAIRQDPEGWSYRPQWQFISVVLSIALMLILFQRSRRTERVVLAEMA